MDDRLISLLREIEPSLEDVLIHGEGADILRFCDALQVNSNIKDLCICSSFPVISTIDSNTVAALSNAIARMPMIVCFSVINFDFEGCEMARSFAPCLANKDTLLRLEMRCCNIGDREARAISSSFCENNFLQVLDLSENRIGNAGATAVASMIAHTDSLKEVSLDYNQFGSEGAVAIAQAMSQNTSITHLVLAEEYKIYSDDVKIAFRTALYNDKSIESIMSSNHTLREVTPDSLIDDWMYQIQSYRPPKARKEKIRRLLEEKPTSLLSTCRDFDTSLMAAVFEKIGRRSRYLGTMLELVRNTPDLIKNARKRPYRQCRKRTKHAYNA